MTIKSNFPASQRRLGVAWITDGVHVNVVGEHSALRVSPEDFAREVAAAGIPGLTVTYEKPAPPLPTEPGLYIAAAMAGEVARASVYRLGYDGVWSESGISFGIASASSMVGAADLERMRGFGLTRLIPENETDV